MVAEVAAAVDVPIIGMGGIMSGLDVLEFVACGATAVASARPTSPIPERRTASSGSSPTR